MMARALDARVVFLRGSPGVVDGLNSIMIEKITALNFLWLSIWNNVAKISNTRDMASCMLFPAIFLFVHWVLKIDIGVMIQQYMVCFHLRIGGDHQ